MKILVKTLIGFAAIAAVLLIVALFVKKDYTVEREITINRSKKEVFNYIKFLKNQANYSVWVMRDPYAKMEYKGADGTVGFVYTWDGNNEVGKGEQEMKKITEGERIEYELHFIKPFEGIAYGYMSTEPVSDPISHREQTKVKWNFKSKMKYPLNFLLLFMNMDNMIGKDQQTGLENLKTVLEKK